MPHGLSLFICVVILIVSLVPLPCLYVLLRVLRNPHRVLFVALCCCCERVQISILIVVSFLVVAIAAVELFGINVADINEASNLQHGIRGSLEKLQIYLKESFIEASLNPAKDGGSGEDGGDPTLSSSFCPSN